MEAHLKLRPLDFAASGIFLCGLAHSPKFLEESIAQAQGAAARALGVLAQEEMYVGGAVARVDPQKCVICLTCMRTCPYGVPRMDQGGGGRRHRPRGLPGLRQLRQRLSPQGHRGDAPPGRQFIAKIGAIGLRPGPRST